MKYLMMAFAASLLALSVPASAQFYPTPMAYGAYAGMYPEMMDNGCCTDFPTHAPNDFVADQLNRQVLQFNATPMMVAPRY